MYVSDCAFLQFVLIVQENAELLLKVGQLYLV